MSAATESLRYLDAGTRAAWREFDDAHFPRFSDDDLVDALFGHSSLDRSVAETSG
jgi:hypothetical protein